MLNNNTTLKILIKKIKFLLIVVPILILCFVLLPLHSQLIEEKVIVEVPEIKDLEVEIEILKKNNKAKHREEFIQDHRILIDIPILILQMKETKE